MTEDILKLIEGSFEFKQNKKKYVLDLLNQIKELNKDETVIKYLNLLDEFNSIDYIGILNFSLEDMLASSLRAHMHLIKETNNIYFYLGEFMLDNTNDFRFGPKDVKLDAGDSKAEYKIYINIENNNKIRIPINESKNFESKHKVIFSDQIQLNSAFINAQTEFIKTALEEGQEAACDKILSKKWQKNNI